MTNKSTATPPSVAVIGGGWAGLAAASTLASQGVSVTLFESAPHLGGRARNIAWQGNALDNGQHILLGAYRETLSLMRLIGLDPDRLLRRLPLRLLVLDELDLNTARLPAPLHLLFGLLRAKGLDRTERLAALRLMTCLKVTGFKVVRDLPLGQFLKDKQQPARLTALLWEPLCLAALNTPLHLASTQVFLNVLRDSFSRSRHDSDLLLPSCGLSDLLPSAAAEFIQRHHGTVHTSTRVSSITQQGDGYRVDTADSASLFSHVVVAVSPWQLAGLTSELPQLAHETTLTSRLEYQPICTVYLQYALSAVLPYPMLALHGGMTQWVLDRGQLLGQHGLLAVVISAEGRHRHLTQEALAASIMDELRTAMPALGDPLWTKVVTEKRATFACTPDLARPPQHTALPNFHLAGDYTAGDYPATLEGAVRSGVKCAQCILKGC